MKKFALNIGFSHLERPNFHSRTTAYFNAVCDRSILALFIYTAIAPPYAIAFLIRNENRYAKLVAD